jgi:ParB family transcriptional regulator, chromosome partitioning protein
MTDTQVVELGLASLHASKTNPRETFDAESLKELAASIKAKGVLVPLLARRNKSGYEIVAGERRQRAAKLAGLDTVPVIVRELNDTEVLEIQVVENEQREDVHPLEQSTGYDRLVKSGVSASEVAARIGKTAVHVCQRLRYVNLIEFFRKKFFANELGIAHADLIARLEPEHQKALTDWFKDRAPWNATVTLKDLDLHIQRSFFLLLKEAPFDTEDDKLDAKAGSCLACPKRTGNNSLFADIKEKDTCTDLACFENKVKLHVKRQVGTHPDAILLTIGYIGQPATGKPKGRVIWAKAGKKTCKDTKEGVVVEKSSRIEESGQEGVTLGQVLKVCINDRCKTHFHVTETTATKTKNADREAEKARKLELHRRGLLFKEVAAKSFAIKPDDRRAILDHWIDGLSSDNARAICKALGLAPKEQQYGESHGAAIEAHLSDLDSASVEKWIYLLMLAEKDLWFYNHTKIEKPKLLEARAEAVGVSVSAISKLSKEKPTSKPTLVPEKKKKGK